MALRSNHAIPGSEMLTTLKSEFGYRLLAPAELEIFFDRRPELFAPTAKASSAIEEFFPNRKGVELSLSKDYDGDDPITDGMLVITIQLPALDVDEQLAPLDAFTDQWWVNPGKSTPAARELVFNLQSYD